MWPVSVYRSSFFNDIAIVTRTGKFKNDITFLDYFRTSKRWIRILTDSITSFRNRIFVI